MALQLPSHEEYHYESLEPKQVHTLSARITQRRLIVVLALALLALIGYDLHRAVRTKASTSSLSPSLQQSPISTSITPSFAADTRPTSTVSSLSLLAPTPCLPSTAQDVTETEHHIAEEDWHMPVDVTLLQSDLLYRTQLRPFFRQEPKNIHREKGMGTEVNLTDAPFVRRSLYRHLLHSFHAFGQQHNFHFWLAHGTLLGQQWGQKIMTGDTDVDVQCSLGDLHRVRKFEKQLWEGRFELLVNPHYLIRRTRNYRELGREKNVIDARWIDILTGFYIDVTALSSQQSSEPQYDIPPFEGGGKVAKILSDKSPHRYGIDSISPTRPCHFEGLEMWCPNKIDAILSEEYNDYNRPHFHTWRFNQTIQAFNEISCPTLVQMYLHPTPQTCDAECREVVSNDRSLFYAALVMTGDETQMGCLLTVTWQQEDKEITREYWGREVRGQPKNPLKYVNGTIPAVVF